MKQAVKKKTAGAKPSINDIKAALGLNVTKTDISKTVADKPMTFIPMPEAFVEATKIPGIPQGYMTIVTGWSNTGKSTLKNCLIASCINNGILPVIFETETNFDFSYAIDCGMKASPVWGEVEVDDVDEETGEILGTHIENQIITYEGEFLYYDGDLLCQLYGDNDYSTGKKVSKRRSVPVIEDIAYAINDLLDKQDEGLIQQPMCFIWDSVGSISSFKSYASKTGNNMFDAGALSVAFNTILNSRIPLSRKVSRDYTNTFFCVNKIWNDSMNAVGPAASIELKGGKSLYYAARLIIHMGGTAKAGVKKLTATAKGASYNYGITTKIKVTKNQLPSPFNITYEGDIACVHCGFCSVDKLDEYKKTHGKELLERLEKTTEALSADVTDITFSESASEVED